MTTFNRTYRSPKFFLCVHHTEEAHVGFEPAEERFSHFSFICRGGGRFHALVDGEFVSHTSMGVKELFPVGNTLTAMLLANRTKIQEQFLSIRGIKMISGKVDSLKQESWVPLKSMQRLFALRVLVPLMVKRYKN